MAAEFSTMIEKFIDAVCCSHDKQQIERGQWLLQGNGGGQSTRIHCRTIGQTYSMESLYVVMSDISEDPPEL